MRKSKPPLRPDNSMAAIDKRIDAAMRGLDDASALMVDQVYRPYCKLMIMYGKEDVNPRLVLNAVAILIANVVHEATQSMTALGPAQALDQRIMEVAQRMLDARYTEKERLN